MSTFAGLNIAPGPLKYTGGQYVITDDYRVYGFGSKYGTTEGSYYHKYNVNVSSVSYDGKTDWRIPSFSELKSIVGTTRIGSTVNGNSNIRFALIQLAAGEISGDSHTFGGTLIFPDGYTIIGKTLSGSNGTTVTYNFSYNELQNYINQGCRFWYPTAYYNYGGVGWPYDAETNMTQLWSSTLYNSKNYYNFRVLVAHPSAGTQIVWNDSSPTNSCYMPIILVRTAS